MSRLARDHVADAARGLIASPERLCNLAALRNLSIPNEDCLGSVDIYQLLTRELDAVYRLAFHLVSRPQDAEDFVQETYYRALKAADRFQLQEFGPRPWLFRILHNVISSHYTSQQRESKHLLQLHEQTPPTPDIDNLAKNDLAGLQWDAIDGRLKNALQALSMPAQITFLLYALEGLKYREIAAVTEVPVGTVMSRLSRARTELTKHLGDYAKEQGWKSQARKIDAFAPEEPEGIRDDLNNIPTAPGIEKIETELKDS